MNLRCRLGLHAWGYQRITLVFNGFGGRLIAPYNRVCMRCGRRERKDEPA